MDWFFDKTNEDFEVRWLVPILYRLSSDLKSAADMADSSKNDMDRNTLRLAINELIKGFTGVVREKTAVTSLTSKKHAIFVCTNILFKAYFDINTLHLCQKLINFVDGPSGVNNYLQVFPVSDVVMYKFYVGRLKMFEDKYDEASTYLRYTNTTNNANITTANYHRYLVLH